MPWPGKRPGALRVVDEVDPRRRRRDQAGCESRPVLVSCRRGVPCWIQRLPALTYTMRAVDADSGFDDRRFARRRASGRAPVGPPPPRGRPGFRGPVPIPGRQEWEADRRAGRASPGARRPRGPTDEQDRRQERTGCGQARTGRRSCGATAPRVLAPAGHAATRRRHAPRGEAAARRACGRAGRRRRISSWRDSKPPKRRLARRAATSTRSPSRTGVRPGRPGRRRCRRGRRRSRRRVSWVWPPPAARTRVTVSPWTPTSGSGFPGPVGRARPGRRAARSRPPRAGRARSRAEHGRGSGRPRGAASSARKRSRNSSQRSARDLEAGRAAVAAVAHEEVGAGCQRGGKVVARPAPGTRPGGGRRARPPRPPAGPAPRRAARRRGRSIADRPWPADDAWPAAVHGVGAPGARGSSRAVRVSVAAGRRWRPRARAAQLGGLGRRRRPAGARRRPSASPTRPAALRRGAIANPTVSSVDRGRRDAGRRQQRGDARAAAPSASAPGPAARSPGSRRAPARRPRPSPIVGQVRERRAAAGRSRRGGRAAARPA